MAPINQDIRMAKQNQRPASYFIFLFMIVAALGAWGCASSKARNTESLLSAAGFETLTPKTPQQQSVYDSLPPNQLQRREINGKAIYAYADKKSGFAYVGTEADYQKFKQLGVQQQIAQDQLQAAQMNNSAAMNWGYWGPDRLWR